MLAFQANKIRKNVLQIVERVQHPLFIARVNNEATKRCLVAFLYVENPQLDWGFSKAFSFESLTKKLLLIRYNCGPPTAKNYQKEVVK